MIEACLDSSPTEWTSPMVDNSVLAPSADETKLVEGLWGILFASRGLRKHSKRAAPKEPTDASGSTTEAPAEKGRELVSKGKEQVEVEEVPERGYSIKDLCEVEGRAGVDGCFASIMIRLKTVEVSAGTLHAALMKQLFECSSEELMKWVAKSTVKLGASQELVVAIKRRVKEPKETIEWLRVEVWSFLPDLEEDLDPSVVVEC
ncbi:hypothetical protein B296_00051126 [Ensete ventricosum]|uniref:Uncharacterized protein n=1 Tax=Ensete ventricosum TaxID=4639 RepID=A0A426X839_ENSVE|nr:hypothetical protein B296_00051126 [Ensete ventricosum]